MKCIIFCINYNSNNELINYLESIDLAYKFQKHYIDLNVVIIDNSDYVKKIDCERYSFTIYQIETGKNLGYFGGFEYGLKNFKNQLNSFDYIIVSNVDLKLSNDFFEKLRNIHINSNVGCIAPSIFSKKEKKDRNPKIIKKYSLKKLKTLCLMYKYPPLYYVYTLLFYNKRRNKINHEDNQIIYGAHGSFMIFTNKFVDFLMQMNYPTFLFGEEIFIAEHLSKLNLETIYLPELLIYDSEHASTSKMKKKFYFQCNYDALKTMIKEFYKNE